jgi:two-component system response regulator FlrC
MTSSDPRMQPVLDLMRKAAQCSANVLVEGESGVGKAHLARCVHEESLHGTGAFRSIFCAPEKRAGGEGKRVISLLEAWDPEWGSIYVRGVDLLDPVSQRMLLAYLDAREAGIASDPEGFSRARLIFSSQTDLLAEARAGRFLNQLYMRISVVKISIPPLRQRESDIVELARHFVWFYSRRQSKRIGKLSREAEAMLRTSPWDGNIRELKNVMNRAVVMANDGDSLGPRELGSMLQRVNT